MSEQAVTAELVDESHDVLPLRLRDVKPFYNFAQFHPVAESIDRIQSELRFKGKLAAKEWDQQYWLTLIMGVVAFLLGSVSPEIFSGGSPDDTGIQGLEVIGGFAFFQMLVSIVIWGWFILQIARMFPIMRVHSISLLVFWNAIVIAQLMFHQNQMNFPVGASVSDMLGGTLVTLTVVFFIYFFCKAVVETRDLHVEEYHVHEDVRVMETEMAEHSLMGWGVICVAWFFLISVSAWSGANFVSERGGDRIGSYSVHIITGLLSLPIFLMMVWYPHRMLGTDVRVTTKAALRAESQMQDSTVATTSTASICPECEAAVPIVRDKLGQIQLPCPTEGCTGFDTAGKKCPQCTTIIPTRYDCPKCGINAPVLDFISDSEAW